MTFTLTNFQFEAPDVPFYTEDKRYARVCICTCNPTIGEKGGTLLGSVASLPIEEMQIPWKMTSPVESTSW